MPTTQLNSNVNLGKLTSYEATDDIGDYNAKPVLTGDKEESNKTQRTLIYTHLGEARNSTANPIHHETRVVIIEDSLSPVRENGKRQDS